MTRLDKELQRLNAMCKEDQDKLIKWEAKTKVPFYSEHLGRYIVIQRGVIIATGDEVIMRHAV